MPRVTHFDLSAEDPERAMNFYRLVFGWSFVKWQGPMDYWMVSSGRDEPGIDGGLARKSDMIPSVYFTISVSPIDEYILKVKENGGKVLRDRVAIPGVGWFAIIQDPEGNAFGLMEDDENAR